MGIASLASPMMNLSVRDESIGWTFDGLKHRLEREKQVHQIEEQLPKEERTPNRKTRTVTQTEYLETEEEYQQRVDELCASTREALEDAIATSIENIQYDDFIQETDAQTEERFVQPDDDVFDILEQIEEAAKTIIASEEACEENDWDPIARIVDSHVVGVDLNTMLTGPIPATNEILAQNDLMADDLDRFEVNEAFASVVAAWLKETGADWERTNVWGGAIAHGHPLGATGAALLGKFPYQLEECGGRYGLCTMCIGFGQGIAIIVERV